MIQGRRLPGDRQARFRVRHRRLARVHHLRRRRHLALPRRLRPAQQGTEEAPEEPGTKKGLGFVPMGHGSPSRRVDSEAYWERSSKNMIFRIIRPHIIKRVVAAPRIKNELPVIHHSRNAMDVIRSLRSTCATCKARACCGAAASATRRTAARVPTQRLERAQALVQAPRRPRRVGLPRTASRDARPSPSPAAPTDTSSSPSTSRCASLQAFEVEMYDLCVLGRRAPQPVPDMLFKCGPGASTRSPTST